MPVFDAQLAAPTLDDAFEGQDFLMAVLHPGRGAQARAKVLGRRRAAKGNGFTLPPAPEARGSDRRDAGMLSHHEIG